MPASKPFSELASAVQNLRAALAAEASANADVARAHRALAEAEGRAADARTVTTDARFDLDAILKKALR